MKQKSPIYIKSVVAIILVTIAGIYFLLRDSKPKTSFQKIAGRIVSISKTNDNYPGKVAFKYRYLPIDNYEKPFELFVGKSAVDFKPLFENIDGLGTGDSVTIYFEETYQTSAALVNNLAHFIDRGKEPFFIEAIQKNTCYTGSLFFAHYLSPYFIF